MADRAYSLLHVKAIDVARRTFAGVATTPELDRQGHVLDPLGARFRNPLPLLFHHDVERPIGTVTLFAPTVDGIPFEATLPTIDEAGALRERVSEAWQLIKAGIMTGVSIGFRILDGAIEALPGGGLKLCKTEILELSLVTIPANASASILTVKSLAAATGPAPGDTGSVTFPVTRVPVMDTIPIGEQIKTSEATRAAKAARMIELMNTAGTQGATLDEVQQKEYDTFDGDVRKLDDHLVRLRRVETLNLAAATPLPAMVTPAAAADLRGGVVTVTSRAPKGAAFIRALCAMAQAKGDSMRAQAIATRWKDSTPEVELYLKAAVAAGTTTDATWAGALVTVNNVQNEFLELLRPATILGKIPGLFNVPFNSSIPIQTGGGTFGWVGQGAPKPVTSLAFSAVTLGIAKVSGIVVLTEELIKLSSPNAESVVRTSMVNDIAKFLDQQFIDPAVAEVTNVSPASITNGTTPIVSSGDILEDIQALVATFTAANMPLEGITLIMSATNAFTLGMVRTTDGSVMFPGMSATGGAISGINIVTSNTAGTNVIMLQPKYVLYADDGAVTIDVSREASVQMNDAPDNPATATTVYTNFFQNNLVGLRAERFVNWKRGVLAAVKYVSGATYTPAVFGARGGNGAAAAQAREAAAKKTSKGES